MSYIKYDSGVKKRMGRPATGHKPTLSVRMEPGALKAALHQAKERGKTLGVWLEEAVQEKIEREGGRNE